MPHLQYLSTYDYIFEQELTSYQNTFNIPYIWQCWLQGIHSAPPLIKLCFKSIAEKQKQHKVKILDINNIQDFITIPPHIIFKYKKNIIPHAHFTDYIRVALLAKYGGTWIDATVFLSQSLPHYIFAQKFFAPKFPPWCQLKTLPSAEYIFSSEIRDMDKKCFSNWFMHSQANNRLLQLLQKFLEEYWAKEDELFDYYMFHLFATYAVLKDAKCGKMFLDMPDLNNAHAHLLQQCLHKDYDAALYTQITQASSMHKLTHKINQEFNAQSFVQYLLHHQNTI